MPVTRSKSIHNRRLDAPTPHQHLSRKSSLRKSHTLPLQSVKGGRTTKCVTLHPEKARDDVTSTMSNLTIPKPQKPPSIFRHLPAELWGIIGEHVSSPKDLAALCRVNQSAKHGALTHLYRRPLITNNECELHHVENFCSPDNDGLQHVRHLTVAPSIERVRRPGLEQFGESRAKTLEGDVVVKVLATISRMPLLQSIALCSDFYGATNLTNHGLVPYKQPYIREIVPRGFYEHGCCFGHNTDTWKPQYSIWSVTDGLKCDKVEQKALFDSKLGFCLLKGVKDDHTLAWRICD